jgi:hypothetical protein
LAHQRQAPERPIDRAVLKMTVAANSTIPMTFLRSMKAVAFDALQILIVDGKRDDSDKVVRFLPLGRNVRVKRDLLGSPCRFWSVRS